MAVPRRLQPTTEVPGGTRAPLSTDHRRASRHRHAPFNRPSPCLEAPARRFQPTPALPRGTRAPLSTDPRHARGTGTPLSTGPCRASRHRLAAFSRPGGTSRQDESMLAPRSRSFRHLGVSAHDNLPSTPHINPRRSSRSAPPVATRLRGHQGQARFARRLRRPLTAPTPRGGGTIKAGMRSIPARRGTGPCSH